MFSKQICPILTDHNVDLLYQTECDPHRIPLQPVKKYNHMVWLPFNTIFNITEVLFILIRAQAWHFMKVKIISEI